MSHSRPRSRLPSLVYNIVSPLSFSKQIISPINPITNRKHHRRLCPDTIYRRLRLILLSRTAQFHNLLLGRSSLHPLASIYRHIICPRARCSSVRQPIETSVGDLAAATPCRAHSMGRAEILALPALGFPCTAPDDADEERAQRWKAGGDNGYGGFGG